MRFTRAAVIFEGVTLLVAGFLVAGAIAKLPAVSPDTNASDLPTATSTEGNYTVGPDGVFYHGTRVQSADPGSFEVLSAPGFEGVSKDNTHFFYSTTTLGAVADFRQIPAPTFSTSTGQFVVRVVQQQALPSSGCAHITQTGDCAARVSVSYPQITSTTSAAITLINAEITQAYEKEFAHAVAEGKASPDRGNKNGYERSVAFTGYYMPEKYPFITFAFTDREDFPRAAQGNGGFYYETYNLRTGMMLTPAQVFANNNYEAKTVAYLDEAYFVDAQKNTASSNGLVCTPWPVNPQDPGNIINASDFYIADSGIVVSAQGSTDPCSGYKLDTVIPFSYLAGDLSSTGPLSAGQ